MSADDKRWEVQRGPMWALIAAVILAFAALCWWVA